MKSIDLIKYVPCFKTKINFTVWRCYFSHEKCAWKLHLCFFYFKKQHILLLLKKMIISVSRQTKNVHPYLNQIYWHNCRKNQWNFRKQYKVLLIIYLTNHENMVSSKGILGGPNDYYVCLHIKKLKNVEGIISLYLHIK